MDVSRSEGDESGKCSSNPALSRSESPDNKGRTLSFARRTDFSGENVTELSVAGDADFTFVDAGSCRGTAFGDDLSFAKDGARTPLGAVDCDESPSPHAGSNIPARSNWQPRNAKRGKWAKLQMPQKKRGLFSIPLP